MAHKDPHQETDTLDTDETLATNSLTTRQYHIYQLARDGYTQREIAAQLGYSQTLIHFEYKRALAAIANTLQLHDDGEPTLHNTFKRDWQGNTVAHLPDQTLNEAIHRERLHSLKPKP